MRENSLDRFLRTRPLAAVCIAVVLGAAAGVSAEHGLPLYGIAAAAFSIIMGILCAKRQPHRFTAGLCAILFLSAGYGAWRAQRPELETLRDVQIAGIVADMPEWQNDRGRAVLHLKDAAVNGEGVDYRLRVYAYGAAAREITLADEIRMQTNLYEPSRSGNGAFDFRSYLWAEGIGQYASLEAVEISVAPRDGGFMERMAELRRHLQQRADELFPQNAALLKGLILGDRTDIAEEDEIAFSESGIMHLLAVSGLHVSILAMALTALGVAICVPKVVMTVLVTLLLVAYAILCGGSPSIVRAVVMYLLMQGGVVLQRGRDSLTNLCAACAGMALYNPLWLRQTGFQLSFAAVAGLVMIAPTISQLRDRVPKLLRCGLARWLGDGVIPGASAQLASLPIVLSAFAQVSWVGLLLNIVCIPLATVALILGLATLLLDFAFPATVLALAADGLTGLLLAAARWAAGLPFGLLHIPAMTLPFAMAYALCTALGSAQFRTRMRTRLVALVMLPVLVAGSALLGSYQVARQEFQVTFLDVGQGDAALINAGGNLFLMDVGDGETVADYISDHQLEIEGIFLSHAHDDHAGGLPEVLQACEPDWIALPQSYLGGEADVLALDAIARADAELRLLSAGDVVELSEEIEARVLYPEENMERDGGNESSLLLHVTYGDGSVLFTGDLPMRDEPSQLPECSVLKVAHHGSGYSTSSRFLACTRPTLAVISVGEGNLYRHPTEELLERLKGFGCVVLRTDLHGAITVDIDAGGNVYVKTHYPTGGLE